ncbi:hypothetical protein [Novosphingobium sp. KN65.2]|uniref:hypothetical protein n=1 Tax=Novosphingobium sp. KN65.2 TaxID=1478134 RepID=UPI0005DD7953|nr:hypothetical protein [Novosphingobium sp. KN65.2]CDO34650.1 hypothetical protein SPHV1_1750002 [Novosphingobium sp. KN65.2]
MEPSKAAMERANEYFGGCFPVSNGAMRAFATYIDTVDRVAKLACAEALRSGNADKRGPRVLSALAEIMLPDEPDPLAQAYMAAWPAAPAGQVREKCAELTAALAAAGYEIVKKDGR